MFLILCSANISIEYRRRRKKTIWWFERDPNGFEINIENACRSIRCTQTFIHILYGLAETLTPRFWHVIIAAAVARSIHLTFVHINVHMRISAWLLTINHTHTHTHTLWHDVVIITHSRLVCASVVCVKHRRQSTAWPMIWMRIRCVYDGNRSK